MEREFIYKPMSKCIKKAVKSLGIKETINKLMMIQRLHRKNKTGQICAKDILYLKKNYKK